MPWRAGRRKTHLRDLVLKDEDLLRHLSAEDINELFSFENIQNKLKNNVDIIFARNGFS